MRAVKHIRMFREDWIVILRFCLMDMVSHNIEKIFKNHITSYISNITSPDSIFYQVCSPQVCYQSLQLYKQRKINLRVKSVLAIHHYILEWELYNMTIWCLIPNKQIYVICLAQVISRHDCWDCQSEMWNIWHFKETCRGAISLLMKAIFQQHIMSIFRDKNLVLMKWLFIW